MKTIRVTITKCITQDVFFAYLFLNCSNFGKFNLKLLKLIFKNKSIFNKEMLNMGHDYGSNRRPIYKTNTGVHSTYIQSSRSRLLVEACVVVKATQQISTCQQTTRVASTQPPPNAPITSNFSCKSIVDLLQQVEIFSWGASTSTITSSGKILLCWALPSHWIQLLEVLPY